MSMIEQNNFTAEQSGADQAPPFEKRYFVSVNATDHIDGMLIAFSQADAENYSAMDLAELTQAQFESVGQDCQFIDGEVVKGPPLVPVLTAEASKAILKARIRDASEKIQTLADAVKLGMAQAGDSDRLTAWETYRVRLSQVDTSTPLADWPAEPADVEAA